MHAARHESRSVARSPRPTRPCPSPPALGGPSMGPWGRCQFFGAQRGSRSGPWLPHGGWPQGTRPGFQLQPWRGDAEEGQGRQGVDAEGPSRSKREWGEGGASQTL